jgi:hypothetical protein
LFGFACTARPSAYVPHSHRPTSDSPEVKSMSGHSPIDSLRRLAAVSDSDAAELFGVAAREELLAGVTCLPLRRSARRRLPVTRRRLVLAFVALAVAATATAATWVIVGSPARETTSVECLIGTSDAVIPSTSGNPAHDCAVDYKREFATAAPRLAAYDNGLGGVTVIPRGQRPQAGWKRLVSGQDVDLIQLQDSLDDYINGLNSSCLNSGEATSLAESRLAQFGFTGWTVRSQKAAPAASTSGTRTCFASDIVDPTTESVTLIPVGIRTGSETTFQKLADKLQPLTQSCESLPSAVAAVRAAASGLGLSESARGYDLNTVIDNSARCVSIYETVGGTIFVTVRGPHNKN